MMGRRGPAPAPPAAASSVPGPARYAPFPFRVGHQAAMTSMRNTPAKTDRWGLRNVPVKGGKTRDIPLPAIVMQFLDGYVTQHLPPIVEAVSPDTQLFWSIYGQRRQGTVRRPMEGKNICRLCKTYGQIIGYPMLKPHDLRHGVAMEVYEQHHDLEQVRGLLGHTRIETTQLYAQIRPAALKQAVEFYETKALDVLRP